MSNIFRNNKNANDYTKKVNGFERTLAHALDGSTNYKAEGLLKQQGSFVVLYTFIV